ncbi:inositol polyphosphate-4-phosphatase type I A isoform X2 [Biomphalaria glabrata]|nr:inositol polyphosphate-4-phosphatase type I A isoform X2 [Biomphalaria glabrata]
MRFNSKELSLLVQQTSKYDKEGYLMMKEKQEGFFKKQEAYVNRYVRLRGNLLFYFKSKDSKSEPLGVVVLERCAVELAVDQETKNGFLLVFEGEDQPFRFDAHTEEIRDAWIQCLHIASHECLKMQLQSLREQLHTKTGTDPVQLPTECNSSVDFESHSDNASQEPVIEISLACSGLPNDTSDVAPNALVVVHTMLPPQQQIWMHHNHTEIIEKDNNPHFLKTIGFGDKFGIDTSTRVRLTVHNVVERMTGTMSPIGQTTFTIQDLFANNDLTLTLKLSGNRSKDCGTVRVTAWINDDKLSVAQLQNQKEGTYNRRTKSASIKNQSHQLQAHFNDIIKRSFRFATNSERSEIQVSEYMAESKWTFELPIQLLHLWVQEEKCMISMLQDLGELVTEWEEEQLIWKSLGFAFDENFAKKEAADYCMSLIVSYSQHELHLREFAGITFKRSADKGKLELEFIPINLHVERMVVSSDFSTPGKMYDITTVGAFSTHCRDMKNGGLKRVLHQIKASFTPDNSSQQFTKIQRACKYLNEVTELKQEMKRLSDQMYESAVNQQTSLVHEVMAIMKEKIAKVNSLCEEPVVVAAANAYLSAKRNANVSDGADSSSLKNLSVEKTRNSEQKWSGSSCVKSPTMEPWEVTCVNLKAAFVCLQSVVDNFSKTEKTQELVEEIKPALTKVQGLLDIVWARLSLFLTFLCIMENKGQVKQAHEAKIRRDIVNAHAITTLVSTFAAMTLTSKMKDPQFLKQLSTVGILCELEGLLSCYGSELCMLEDMMVAVDDLNFVSFRLVPLKDEDYTPRASLGCFVKEGPYPDIYRHNIIIDMPVNQEVFSLLPKELQAGKEIPVSALAFNIGINEQATLAEKFGSTALQEKLNITSFAKLYEYYVHYSKHFEDPLDKSHGVGSLSHMIKMLQSNVMSKKSKNVEVLHTAAEVIRAMNGLRITFCKSGKDRTSMAVTLEMVHILQRHHNLASHVFIQSLDCLRSVGCRRENTLKNTGVKKYAFISLQMLYIPKLYRAPSGTYGNVQT